MIHFFRCFYCLDKKLEHIIVNYEKNKYMNKLFFIFILIFLFIGMYKLNVYTVMIADDYNMSFNWKTGYLLQNMQDVIESTICYYHYLGGRLIAFALGSSFLIMNDSIFYVINTLGYVILILVLYINIIGKLICKPSLLIIIITALFLFMPAFGQVFLWKIGSAMYMWPSIIYFLFLLIYRLQLNKKENIIKYKVLYVVIFILGSLSTMSNENMSVALIFMISIYIYFYYKIKRVYLWSILGFLGNIIGILILLLAPGNYVRMNAYNVEWIPMLFYNIINITKMFFETEYLFIPICIIIIFLWFTYKMDYRLLIIYFVGVMVALYSMSIVPYFPDRAKLGALLLIIVIIGTLYINLNLENIKVKKLMLIVLIINMSIVISLYDGARIDIKEYKIRNDKKINYVLKEKRINNLDLIVERNNAKTRFNAAYGLEDLYEDPNKWTNQSFARYYDLNTIRIVSDEYYK